MSYLTSLVKSNPLQNDFLHYSKVNSSTCMNASRNQHLFLSPTFNNPTLCRKKITVLLIYKHHTGTGSIERNLLSSCEEKTWESFHKEKFWELKSKIKRKRCEYLKYSQYSLKAATARASVTIMETQETHNAFFL